MNKFIYILIIIFLISIIKHISITNIIILFVIFIGCYSYYNIYEQKNTPQQNILYTFKKFIIFKKFNEYTYNNTQNYIHLFFKNSHLIEELENIRIIIMNNLLSFNINIPYTLKKKLTKYIYNFNKFLLKYIKEQSNYYKGNYLRTIDINNYNKFNYY